MPESYPINKSKLNRLPPQADFAPRPQLLELFEGWQRTPLTLISAPTGYGKTALVSSWLETEDFPHAWISLDKNDDDLTLFLTHFLAAMRAIFPDILEGTLVSNNGLEQPPVQTLANSLINELEQITADYVLVLDNYHSIQKMTIHDLLSVLLRTPPPSMHLLLSTRFDPPLDLVDLRAQGLVKEIRSRAKVFRYFHRVQVPKHICSSTYGPGNCASTKPKPLRNCPNNQPKNHCGNIAGKRLLKRQGLEVCRVISAYSSPPVI